MAQKRPRMALDRPRVPSQGKGGDQLQKRLHGPRNGAGVDFFSLSPAASLLEDVRRPSLKHCTLKSIFPAFGRGGPLATEAEGAQRRTAQQGPPRRRRTSGPGSLWPPSAKVRLGHWRYGFFGFVGAGAKPQLGPLRAVAVLGLENGAYGSRGR